MKHIIIGTAGHIDHGKTTLIKALTGRETDTLREEKERGISINLGFTFFDLPSGKRAGIIDVPGHEKFIKNMLAGISSIDIVLLVIAADEGIMPQTREHFEILQLLDVKKGIIVLTKSDLVDEEWLSMIREEIKNEFKGTFLENAPIHSVSSKTGIGLDDLIEDIDKFTEEVEAKDIQGHFRLPVDRVFTISGFGTVVTGTVISGSVKEGQIIEVYPAKLASKVRGIQVHDQPVKVAEAGQRCAINIANVRVNDVKRGDVISVENLMEPSLMIDCKLYYLKSASRTLENRQRVRLYHGTSEIICRVVLLNKEQVKPGEEVYVQLRLEKPLTAQRNDRYVIRSYSPMNTIGGGSIIEPLAKKAKQFDKEYIEELKLKESGKTESILENTIKNLSKEYPRTVDILKALGKNEESIEEKLEKLINEDKIVKFESGDKAIYVHREFINEKIAEIVNILDKYHKENPLKWGISKEEIKNKVFGKSVKQKTYDQMMDLLVNEQVLLTHGNLILLPEFKIIYTKEQKAIRENIIKSFNIAKFSPPKYSELQIKEKDTKNFKMVFDSIVDEGVLVKVSEDCFFLLEDYIKIKELVINLITNNGSMTLAELRDVLNTSRKYAMALVEHFDSIKLTKRLEDKRVLY
ncbi:selenocysteine-specific translation elongation factor [Clostridiaceae bacterium UIB06]|uniref:Selenocysteine-specific elongation factor n=1 Tax=Clostridium thailandense TaxID=2794346 RepID=A0A949X2B6_9CLOT|nr:selenocysteine-specific translation elongation factor [Clostridium thailandense]MBV7273049.1 selenocysteine-specific translation elongation factor [Clostridium thailandense]MCH5135713.1 selenocysteine-specific translation elongation factor [Clostridiaceae bacterium UIB06]